MNTSGNGRPDGAGRGGENICPGEERVKSEKCENQRLFVIDESLRISRVKSDAEFLQFFLQQFGEKFIFKATAGNENFGVPRFGSGDGPLYLRSDMMSQCAQQIGRRESLFFS